MQLAALVLYWKPLIGLLLSILVTCLTNTIVVLPLNGAYLSVYVLTLWILVTWVTFVALQNFLVKNEILTCNIARKEETSAKKDNVANLDSIKLIDDIDQHFIRKWFDYISTDPTFPEECKVILRDVMGRLVKVQPSVNYGSIIQGFLNLYLKHLKEFRRSLKRRNKYGGSISNLYQFGDVKLFLHCSYYVICRFSHSHGTSSEATDHFMHELTTSILNIFINWELRNSLPYQVLVAIISKKVVAYIVKLFSSPEFINYQLLYYIASQSKRDELNLNQFNRIKLTNISWIEDSDSKTLLKSSGEETNVEVTEKCDGNDAPVSDIAKDELASTIDKEVTGCQTISQIDNFKSVPLVNSEISNKVIHKAPLSSDANNVLSEKVKIYEPKSYKTWYDSYDLESVTLGQDMLDMINMDYLKITEEISADVEKEDTLQSSAKHLLDEVKHMTSIEGIKTSMKPISDVTANTLHNIKDLQESTVQNVMKPVSHATSTALHKIGGLHLQDEAAGVVEGILDFGRTKIRKGLRLTGLQDSDELVPIVPRKNTSNLSHAKSQDKGDELETMWINPLLGDLVKNVASRDEPDKVTQNIPSITTQVHDEGSPEPEYEETADLASSIAKLRSLLEQKSSESNRSTPLISPMPTDEFANKMFESEDADEVDGVMPSFYKFCAKTATGVFNNTLNTIKTALPGNATDCARFAGSEKWLFVEHNSSEENVWIAACIVLCCIQLGRVSFRRAIFVILCNLTKNLKDRGNGNDLYSQMNKLLTERKVFCTVDTAYEAIDSFVPLKQIEKKSETSNIIFEDELDDFEVKLPIVKAMLDIMCDLLADTDEAFLTKEPVMKSLLLVFGNHIENFVETQTNCFISNLWKNASIPTGAEVSLLTMEIDTFTDIVVNCIPEHIKCLAGEGSLKEAVNLFISSLQLSVVNQDILMQMLEIVYVKLINSSRQCSEMLC